MITSSTSDEDAGARLMEALSDDVLNTPAEQLLAEEIEDEGNLRTLTREFDEITERALERAVEQINPGVWFKPGSFLGFFRSLRIVAYTAAAAAIVLMVLASALTWMVVGEHRTDAPELSSRVSYKRIAADSRANGFTGVSMLVRFRPGANAAEIAGFLYSHNLSIASGPDKEGTYLARLSGPTSSKYDSDTLIAQLRADSVVAFLQVE